MWNISQSGGKHDLAGNHHTVRASPSTADHRARLVHPGAALLSAMELGYGSTIGFRVCVSHRNGQQSPSLYAPPCHR